jgi:N-acetylglucosaminyl-diphospho-decaprenol L-rhamnosyltransferase
MTPQVDVIIVNHNTAADVLACLRSLHDAPPSAGHRIVVVDNGSTDDSVARVRERFPAVEVMPLGRNAGFAAANNAAIRATSAARILLLNSDTTVPAGAIDRLLERLDATGAVAAGPRLVDGQGRPELSWGPMLSPAAEAWQALRHRIAAHPGTWARRQADAWTSREREVDWISGACLLVRREATEAAGLLDERYFMYEEDVDFCAALRAGGGRILFTPAATVVHLRGRSVAAAGRRPSAYYDRSHLEFYRKHAPGWVPLLRWWLAVRGRSVDTRG